MSDREALIALRDAVVAGKWGPETQALRSPPSTFKTPFAPEPMDKRRRQAWSAYHGSVDAAIALLEAVLPRTQFHLSDEASGDGYVGQIFDCELDRYTGTGHDAIASRALLIAAMNAMIAKEQE